MTVVDIIRNNAGQFATNSAVIDLGSGAARTYQDFFERVDRLSQGFLSLGLKKGDRVLAWLPNCAEAIESELACLQSGGVWVSLHMSLTWHEVESVLRATEPRIAVVGYSSRDRIRAHVLDMLSTHIITLGGEFQGGTSYEKLVDAHEAKRPGIHIDEEDLARLRYTSGTTGSAKAAMLPHRVYVASLRNLQAELHPLDETDRVLHAAPLTHATAALMFPILSAGGANYVLPRFDPDEVLRTIERDRITTMFAVPTILQRLVQSEVFNSSDLTTLRTITYGGAPATPGQLESWIQRLPGVLVQIYGLTEALHPVTVLRRSEHINPSSRLGSIGVPTAVNEVCLLDESGSRVENGEVGELTVRGLNVMSGYWQDPAATEAAFRDGWLLTGDLATRDPDGYYTIVDRKKDVVISGGMNVYTAEVESVLCSHPMVQEAAVLGLPHADWGESVHAVVVTNSDTTEAALLAYCRERLAGYKCPKRVTFWDGPLPASGSGKLLKPKVFDLLVERGLV